MSPRDRALAVLRDWPAPGADQSALRDDFVAFLEARSDALLRSCRSTHLTAGTLVLSDDGESVLLNLHRKARRWFHFGGHIEPGETLAAAALREATEESGIVDLVLSGEPVHLSSHAVPFCQPDRTVTHLDVRYVARVAAGATHVVSEESLDVRWFPVGDLPTEEPDMIELVRLARQSQGSRPSDAAAETPSR